MKPLHGIVLGVSMALAGCAAPGPIPDFTYYRLPAPQYGPPLPAPLFRETLVVDALGADGLYADKALIHALGPGAQELRQYHYQLWTDPPTRILQRRLIAQLRSAGLSPLVTDELPASKPAVRISGIILRFDRIPDGHGGFTAAVTLKLRADRNGVPLVDDYFLAEKVADGPTLKATVDAFGAAIDQIFAEFETELRHHGDVASAR